MRRIYDVTIPAREGLAGWPGDTPYGFGLAWSRAAGATVNVGRVAMSIHTGTHVDAPFHFDDSGATADLLGLDAFLGPSLVADVRGLGVIGVEDLRALDLAATPRLLLRTGGWEDHSRFPASIPVVGEGVAGFLADRGVILLGVDVPSVDPLDSQGLANHHALARAGIAILEGLDLSAVPPGPYELIALPLRLVGADGAPARAILRDLGRAPEGGPAGAVGVTGR